MMVTRLDVCCFSGEHIEPQGKYVLFGDYDILHEAYNDAILDARNYKELYEDLYSEYNKVILTNKVLLKGYSSLLEAYERLNKLFKESLESNDEQNK